MGEGLEEVEGAKTNRYRPKLELSDVEERRKERQSAT
jgi:hypothetical protein